MCLPSTFLVIEVSIMQPLKTIIKLWLINTTYVRVSKIHHKSPKMFSHYSNKATPTSCPISRTLSASRPVPYPPVGQLELFVCLHLTAVMEEEGQREFGQLQCLAGLTSVKEVHHVQTKVLLQPLHIVVGTVHHL